MLHVLARERPEDLAISDGSRERSFAELWNRSCAVACELARVGVRPDDHVALLLGNRVEFLEVVLGCVLAGVWLTPINRHLAQAEIHYILADSGARMLFTEEEHSDRAPPGLACLTVGAEYERQLSKHAGSSVDLSGPAGGAMIYTSGTSGRPKGVKRRRADSVAAALEGFAASGQALGLDGAGPHLVTGPMYHAAPLMLALYDLMNGGPMIVLPRFDERETLRLIADRRVCHAHLVPTMFVRLLRLPEGERAAHDLSSLSLVLHGAAPIAEHTKQAMIEWWGPVLTEYWGATEAGVYTRVDSEEWLEHPGTVGRALRQFEVFAMSDEGGRLPAGEIGVLCCRHRELETPFEYHGDPEKTAGAYRGGGVFTVGDMGWLDPEGYVYLADRKSNMIISGGVNIYPAEIEAALQRDPRVADCVVFGIPDEEWGESVKAAVELTTDAALKPTDALKAELLGGLEPHLASFKIPRSIDFIPQLPRHDTGKLRVREIRDRYWVGRKRKI